MTEFGLLHLPEERLDDIFVAVFHVGSVFTCSVFPVDNQTREVPP